MRSVSYKRFREMVLKGYSAWVRRLDNRVTPPDPLALALNDRIHFQDYGGTICHREYYYPLDNFLDEIRLPDNSAINSALRDYFMENDSLVLEYRDLSMDLPGATFISGHTLPHIPSFVDLGAYPASTIEWMEHYEKIYDGHVEKDPNVEMVLDDMRPVEDDEVLKSKLLDKLEDARRYAAEHPGELCSYLKASQRGEWQVAEHSGNGQDQKYEGPEIGR